MRMSNLVQLNCVHRETPLPSPLDKGYTSSNLLFKVYHAAKHEVSFLRRSTEGLELKCQKGETSKNTMLKARNSGTKEE